jgi:alanyl-tRNA synthetase
MAMTSDEIRDTYRTFFEERGHLAQRGASLIPPPNDPSALFIVAGMHPLKAYFAGTEQPPARRLTTCQPAFRTVDIENVGMTARHLTLFEMLGNFSFGDYFKRDAIAFAWDLSRHGFGLAEEDIWVTVFGGDEQLGIGPDQEAIDLWLEVGMPRERIVECPRSENFWESGPTGPCGPDSELYLDLGLDRGEPDDLPGGENERFLEFWNLVFMQFDQNPPNTVTPLPSKNIDTGLGLNRMAAILQGKETVFETDQFAPLITLGEELSGRRYGQDFNTDRALRILADHSRAATFLVADGVVPSNEERGYVLRRIMRRAILQGRETLGLDPGFLLRYQDGVTELMGAEYGQLVSQRELVAKWFASEEEGFGRTLDEGMKLLDDLIEQAKERGDEGIAAADAFKLHDTHGFPFDLTLELVTEHGLGVDESGFEALMGEQRRQSRASGARAAIGADLREQAAALVAEADFKTEFQGYEKTSVDTTVGTISSAGGDGRLLVKLLESPFYATGGGQVADAGYLECGDGDCLVRVDDVIRVGDDQVLAVVPERGALHDGERVHAHVDAATRHATAANHTATHLLHAALRARLGSHVHQAGSYVGPDKLRFDFTHTAALGEQELADVEDQVNAWILEAHPVRWMTTTIDEARSLGAMALFGEKYGEIVRMVEVGGAGSAAADQIFSRELCGGTHVRNTAEVALLKITAETSSAANVRRIEALTGPAAVAMMRSHDRALATVADALRVTAPAAPDAVLALRERVRELERDLKRGQNGGVDLEALIAGAVTLDGASVLTAVVDGVGGQGLLDLADRLKARLGDAAIVLGAAADGKVDIVAAVAPALVQRGVKAGEIVRAAAVVVGGGGGGRDTAARAGGRDVAKLGDAVQVARTAIERALSD